MSLAHQIGVIVEQLPEVEQRLVFELVKRISPDDVLSPEDIADIEEARAEYRRGETVDSESIDWGNA